MNFQGRSIVGKKLLVNSIVLIGIGLLGCSGGPSPDPTAAVTGKVTFQGAAVSEGMINFYDAKRGNAATVKLGADGAYSLPAVVLGDYSVFITPLSVEVPVDATKPAPSPANPANIPEKYRDGKTSGLKTTVKAGTNTASFEMTP